MKEAAFYEKLDGGRVRCLLCPHHCVVKQGKRGVCGVRENSGGALVSLVYRKAVSLNLDPIEKKPFFHFLPGSSSLSIATVGCNMRCLHCQNHSISQAGRKGRIPGEDITPEEVVRIAIEEGALTISYTYSEPTVFYEYAADVMAAAAGKGIRNNWVTNGYIEEEPLRRLLPHLHAANVDLKAFTQRHYSRVCGARLASVMKTIERMAAAGVWVEVTTLLIPDLNDDEESLAGLAKFLRSVSPDIPWHISRFHPVYLMTDRPATPASSIRRAGEIGREAGLRFVYAGNLWGDEGENTFCFNCGAELVRRYGFSVMRNLLKDGRCPKCGVEIRGVWR